METAKILNQTTNNESGDEQQYNTIACFKQLNAISLDFTDEWIYEGDKVMIDSRSYGKFEEAVVTRIEKSKSPSIFIHADDEILEIKVSDINEIHSLQH